MYGIPPGILDIEQNRATATEDRRRLLAFAVEPLARLAESALAEALLTDEQRAQGFNVRIDTSVAMLGQGSELGQAISSLLNSGAVSVNEARMRIGLGAVADGDLLRSPTNTWPLSSWAEAIPRSSESVPKEESESTAARQARTFKLLTGGLVK
jgi:hypothetical protein